MVWRWPLVWPPVVAIVIHVGSPLLMVVSASSSAPTLTPPVVIIPLSPLISSLPFISFRWWIVMRRVFAVMWVMMWGIIPWWWSAPLMMTR